jgi:hypothetical protein
MLSLLLFACHVVAAESPDAAIASHMDAINARNDEAIISSQRFPFGHLWPDGRWELVASAAEFKPIDWKTRLGSEWHRSVLESADQIMSNDDAATYQIVFSRRREDGSVMGRYEAVWIATKIQNDWKVQFRHGAIVLD